MIESSTVVSGNEHRGGATPGVGQRAVGFDPDAVVIEPVTTRIPRLGRWCSAIRLVAMRDEHPTVSSYPRSSSVTEGTYSSRRHRAALDVAQAATAGQ
jgi:hypothetical protein